MTSPRWHTSLHTQKEGEFPKWKPGRRFCSRVSSWRRCHKRPPDTTSSQTEDRCSRVGTMVGGFYGILGMKTGQRANGQLHLTCTTQKSETSERHHQSDDLIYSPSYVVEIKGNMCQVVVSSSGKMIPPYLQLLGLSCFALQREQTNHKSDWSVWLYNLIGRCGHYCCITISWFTVDQLVLVLNVTPEFERIQVLWSVAVRYNNVIYEGCAGTRMFTHCVSAHHRTHTNWRSLVSFMFLFHRRRKWKRNFKVSQML